MPGCLPEIVERFRLEQEQVRSMDAKSNALLLESLAKEDPARAEELLQYALNTTEERRVIDAVEIALQRIGGRVMAIAQMRL